MIDLLKNQVARLTFLRIINIKLKVIILVFGFYERLES